MQTGSVKFYNESKGFGFIIDDDTKQDFFVHNSGLIDKIEQGDNVVFVIEEGRNGFQAVQVKKIESKS